MKYTTIDTIFSKFYRDLKDSDISETDIIEWTGEALDFMSVYETQEEAVAFVEVKNYTADMPDGIKFLTQVARDNNFTCPCEEDEKYSPKEVIIACTNPLQDPAPTEPVPIACDGRPLTDYDVAYYRPYFDLKYEHSFFYNTSYYKNNYTPVRLSNHTMVKNFVCPDPEFTIPCGPDEYTIIGTLTKQFRLSFKEGRILVSFVRTAIDKENGYPLIPDNVSLTNAVVYYIKWKISEMEMWNHKEGSVGQVQYNNKQWLKYCKQAKNYFKMPKTIDDYQNLLEESYQTIPNHKRYYGFFGNLGRKQSTKFKDPDYRNKNRY